MTSASIPSPATITVLTAQLTSGPYYYVGLALLVIILFVALIAAYRVWEEINDVEEPDSPVDLLESFKQAHAEGELDDQELDRVRRLLSQGDMNSEVPPAESRLSPPASPIADACHRDPGAGEETVPHAS